MALINLKEMLTAADKEVYGVGAFNTLNLEMTKAIIDAAEEERSPVIIQIAELLFQFMPDWEALSEATLMLAHKAKVPVVVHLDHGMNFDTTVKAMRLGFSGVMIDGSHLSFEENVRQTKEVVKTAHALGVPVEAELGTVPGEEGLYHTQDTVMTDAALVEQFIGLTEADALAVCIGNAHGNYIKTPCLDLNRLREIKKIARVPLVLHGGSGLTDEDFRSCIRLGINKVNIFTDLCNAAMSQLDAIYRDKREGLSYPKVLSVTSEAVRQEAARKMRLFGSSGKS